VQFQITNLDYNPQQARELISFSKTKDIPAVNAQLNSNFSIYYAKWQTGDDR